MRRSRIDARFVPQLATCKSSLTSNIILTLGHQPDSQTYNESGGSSPLGGECFVDKVAPPSLHKQHGILLIVAKWTAAVQQLVQ